MTEHPCENPNGWDGEYCRTYCLLYGTGRCRYDPDTKKMMVRDEEEGSQ